MTTVVNPLGGAPVVLVTAVGAAEGSWGAAAALACAGADPDRAALLVDVGGRPPRPTLLASTPAQRLEERLTTHLPERRAAARGTVCHLAVPASEEGLESARAAATVGRDSLTVLHCAPPMLQALLDGSDRLAPTGVLLRADVAADRALLALLIADLVERGLAFAVLKRRLSWVAERRALFGALAPERGALSPALLRRLGMEHACYAGGDDAETHPARTAKSERGDHASSGSR